MKKILTTSIVFAICFIILTSTSSIVLAQQFEKNDLNTVLDKLTFFKDSKDKDQIISSLQNLRTKYVQNWKPGDIITSIILTLILIWLLISVWLFGPGPGPIV